MLQRSHNKLKLQYKGVGGMEECQRNNVASFILSYRVTHTNASMLSHLHNQCLSAERPQILYVLPFYFIGGKSELTLSHTVANCIFKEHLTTEIVAHLRYLSVSFHVGENTKKCIFRLYFVVVIFIHFKFQQDLNQFV